MPIQEDDMPLQEAPLPGDVTQLLMKWRSGDEEAFNRLIPIVDAELRRRAHHYLRRERADHMIQTTALIDDVWMRLSPACKVDWQDRAHFYAVAAHVMREILVDEARRRGAKKRDCGWTRASFEEPMAITVELDLDLLALNEALEWLKSLSERKFWVVVLRFFGGFTIKEVAAVLGISVDAVKNDWETAKLWLFRRLSEEAGDGSGAV
jgi:RNA polymerase sigma factor (TIGR02999 family)